MPRGRGTSRTSSLPSFPPFLHYHLQQPEMESTMTAHSDVVCSSHCLLLLLRCTCFSVARVLFWWRDHHGRGERAGVQTVQSLSKEFFLLSIIHHPNPPNPNPFVWSFVASFVMFLRPPRPPGSGLWLAAVPTVNGCVVPCGSPVPTKQSGVFLGHLFGKVVENIGNSSRDCIARFHSRQFPNE